MGGNASGRSTAHGAAGHASYYGDPAPGADPEQAALIEWTAAGACK
ncbi:hypothetical protein HLK59_49875 [Streptomyces sp. S3(2020)]|nr:hypothetical protein [Streptomyces sp. S3(2020)]NNN38269.1 hypothetical protein [Streptomyces sp. S3(2020)]